MNGRGLVAAGILAAWGAGLAALAQRELSRTEVERLAEVAIRVSPVASYYAVERAGRHVGFSSFTTDTVPDGLQFTDYAVTDDSTASDRRHVTQVIARTSRALVLRDVAVRSGTRQATATVIDDSVLRVVRREGNTSDTTRLTFRPPLLLPSLVPMVTALGEPPSRGDRHTWDVFDPSRLAVRRVEVRVRAESTWIVVDSAGLDAGAGRWRGVHADTVNAWHVVEAGGNGIDAWVDEMGQLVASDGGWRGRERRTAYEVAFENWRSGASRSEVATAEPAADTPLLDGVVLRLPGLTSERLQLTNTWQQVAGDTVRVARVTLPETPNGYWVPPHRDHRTRFVRELQVEPFIETESPVVATTARRLRGREPDPVTVSRLLARWVADSIQLDPTPTPPSAAAALRSRAGQGAHRVNAWVAMARASGIPARVVLGVRVHAQGAVPQAWAEGWLRGAWVPVDVQRGTLPADASHVRLMPGSTALLPELERLLDRSPAIILDRTTP